MTSHPQHLCRKKTEMTIKQLAMAVAHALNEQRPPAAPVQEPEFNCPRCGHCCPQRQWVGLTEEEHTQISVDAGCMSSDWVFYGAAVERALKKKNT